MTLIYQGHEVLSVIVSRKNKVKLVSTFFDCYYLFLVAFNQLYHYIILIEFQCSMRHN